MNAGSGDQDQHGPAREGEQQAAVADEGDGVLHQAEGAHDQAQGTAGRLAARLRHAIVELGILEVRQPQGERLLQDHHVHALSEQRPEQRAHHADAALERRLRHDEPHLEADPLQRQAVATAAAVRGDHRVDDQLAHVGDGRG